MCCAPGRVLFPSTKLSVLYFPPSIKREQELGLLQPGVSFFLIFHYRGVPDFSIGFRFFGGFCCLAPSVFFFFFFFFVSLGSCFSYVVISFDGLFFRAPKPFCLSSFFSYALGVWSLPPLIFHPEVPPPYQKSLSRSSAKISFYFSPAVAHEARLHSPFSGPPFSKSASFIPTSCGFSLLCTSSLYNPQKASSFPRYANTCWFIFGPSDLKGSRSVLGTFFFFKKFLPRPSPFHVFIFYPANNHHIFLC